MADLMERDADAESAEEIRKERIEFLKTVLNIYRSKVLSYESCRETLRSDINIPDDMLNFDVLRKQVRALHNSLTHFKSFRDISKIVHNTMTCQGLQNLENTELKMNLRQSMFEISFFNQKIMEMYEKNMNQIENIRKIQHYNSVLNNYQNNLKLLRDKESQSSKTVEEMRRLEKAHMQVKKINFMRNMKHVLIGRFGREFPTLQQFRVSSRKTLTVENFM